MSLPPSSHFPGLNSHPVITTEQDAPSPASGTIAGPLTLAEACQRYSEMANADPLTVHDSRPISSVRDDPLPAHLDIAHQYAVLGLFELHERARVFPPPGPHVAALRDGALTTAGSTAATRDAIDYTSHNSTDDAAAPEHTVTDTSATSPSPTTPPLPAGYSADRYKWMSAYNFGPCPSERKLGSQASKKVATWPNWPSTKQVDDALKCNSPEVVEAAVLLQKYSRQAFVEEEHETEKKRRLQAAWQLLTSDGEQTGTQTHKRPLDSSEADPPAKMMTRVYDEACLPEPILPLPILPDIGPSKSRAVTTYSTTATARPVASTPYSKAAHPRPSASYSRAAATRPVASAVSSTVVTTRPAPSAPSSTPPRKRQRQGPRQPAASRLSKPPLQQGAVLPENLVVGNAWQTTPQGLGMPPRERFCNGTAFDMLTGPDTTTGVCSLHNILHIQSEPDFGLLTRDEVILCMYMRVRPQVYFEVRRLLFIAFHKVCDFDAAGKTINKTMWTKSKAQQVKIIDVNKLSFLHKFYGSLGLWDQTWE
ncbi:hypothetical protein BCR37DRAFT_389428 [Protomyces lactucae-debilis]|uniref:SWIRM domain-containing protein n=1 Tax=Protomyces lactucae-debilis TaxID=2754530 RepID=A0A1Y2EXK6_PROLT|nr:uncharacterized protein BCR37DRAFT_389428 [Protomyces lactucae-debilis]ORY76333.1 hypothetical protein BCR37DRAFT_389428 [Protomyces lactucae-debilis]